MRFGVFVSGRHRCAANLKEAQMDSAMIAKISKAREYAQEPERMTLASFDVVFDGRHQTYHVSFNQGAWQCGCDFFTSAGCVHTMAVEKVLSKTGMVLPQPGRRGLQFFQLRTPFLREAGFCPLDPVGRARELPARLCVERCCETVLAPALEDYLASW